ncbi:S24/S26 family peptidase [Curtobacterium sp. VKM Ac-1376]|uniref:S24/S26 family peptidase n=1 Tax=Curtobacterium sp. VKM Ac-1376 TaxID=123312 RepID=UPI00188C6CFD|nr:S24/S26 family peptidase [Curtobacterium sp. VKM Ac-1376]MBF4614200.1 S24/S26 family peptidase [Curtobacterium sp. VKM Ac-1376]
MSSIAVHGGQAPHAAVRDAVDWGRVVVATLARGVVATLLGLALWAAAPAVIGWQPTTVMTGSMEPRLLPGDVVVSRPVASGAISTGKILLADDPDQPGHLRMHRYVEDGPRSTLITKGDANPQQDSTPLERSAVHGVAFLRIPFVGAPIRWIREGEWVQVVMLALGLTAALALCTIDGSLRRLVAEDNADRADGDADSGSADGTDDGLEARDAAVTGLPTATATVVTRRALRRRARRRQRLRRLGGGAVVLVIAGSVGVLVPAQAVAAPWSRTTSTAATLHAGTATPATALTCTSNRDGSVTIGFAYDGPDAASFSVLNTNANSIAATGPAGSTAPIRVTGSGILTLGAVVTVKIRTNWAGSWHVDSTATARIQTALIGTDLSCAR